MPDAGSLVALVSLVGPLAPSRTASGWLVVAADAPTYDPQEVSPGLPGFLATAAVVLVVIFLLLDFTKRVRRLRLRGEALEREAADRAAADRPVSTGDTGAPGPVRGGEPVRDGGPGRDAGPGRERGSPPDEGPRERP